jgi:hypothetical protein
MSEVSVVVCEYSQGSSFLEGCPKMERRSKEEETDS